jgi:hypothetical protein
VDIRARTPVGQLVHYIQDHLNRVLRPHDCRDRQGSNPSRQRRTFWTDGSHDSGLWSAANDSYPLMDRDRLAPWRSNL